MAKLTVSLAQMQITPGDTTRNFSAFQRMAVEAARRKTTLLVLPELWYSGYALENAKEYADELNKGVFAQLSKISTEGKVAIVGSVLEKRGLEVANSAPFFAPNGRMLGVYRKIHLFKLFDEDKYLQPGQAPLTMDLPWGTTGIAICYDLRFPEIFRRYTVTDGAKMVIVPAEWPLARIEHWRALLIARAIENQCYIIACNAAGPAGDTIMGGHSMIVDPWGKVIVEAGEDPMLLTVDIELDAIADARSKIPVFDDVRLDIYG